MFISAPLAPTPSQTSLFYDASARQGSLVKQNSICGRISGLRYCQPQTSVVKNSECLPRSTFYRFHAINAFESPILR